MKKIVYILAGLCVFSTMLFAQDIAPETTQEKLTSKQIYQTLGNYIASEGQIKFDKLDMKDDDIEAFMSGFKAGLSKRLDQDEFTKNREQISEFIKQKMIEYQDKNPVNFPLDTKIATVDGGETTVRELLKDKNGLLLDFYASWCGPCMALMPKLKEKEIALKEKNIVVAGMNTVGLEDAKKVKEEHGINFTWLVEPEGDPFGSLLGIDSIPRMILIDKTGLVIFNGHPEDERLYIKIETLK